eukprot:s5063_g2.t2
MEVDESKALLEKLLLDLHGCDAPEFSIPSTDLDGLLRYLQGLCHRGLRITEVTYCVNSWNLYGLIPLKHHGFILFTKGCRLDSYLTLDFSSRGILWDTFDTYPDVPEGTFFAKTYKINLDPLALREYCKDTEPHVAVDGHQRGSRCGWCHRQAHEGKRPAERHHHVRWRHGTERDASHRLHAHDDAGHLRVSAHPLSRPFPLIAVLTSAKKLGHVRSEAIC